MRKEVFGTPGGLSMMVVDVQNSLCHSPISELDFYNFLLIISTWGQAEQDPQLSVPFLCLIDLC